ncbi:SPOR domain-containing protein, partial [bacterium]|nr:SPOR domain-containing protein [bacterium]
TPPQKKGSGIAFTGMILAIVIIVAGGTFLLTQTCERATEEHEDAYEVLEDAPDVNLEGENTRELVFYTSEGELVVIPSEVAEGEPTETEPLELPPELIEIMESGNGVENGGNGETTPPIEPPEGILTYSVQVGAFGEADNAQKLVDKLGADGYRAYVVEPLASDEKPLYRVRVGLFHDLDEAATTASELQEKYGLSPYIPR